MILGLPLALFALQMISVIASLLLIIFSFSLGMIVTILLWNIALYVLLSKLVQNPGLFHFQKVFPQNISNKKLSPFYDEND
ncbi:MAG TPA: hypothetical protein DCO64_07915 [Zunongwangia profunda]|nr:hypothetical protein [Zunongwangia profunda]